MPVRVLPLAEGRRLFDVNFFGHVAMMQALLPALVESHGTVVNSSSVCSKVAMATSVLTPARSSPSNRSATYGADRSSRLARRSSRSNRRRRD